MALTAFDFRQLEAESLPFEDAMDVVMTGMALGLLPNQDKAITGMVRVLRPGGLLSVGAHGLEHYKQTTIFIEHTRLQSVVKTIHAQR
jgi:ubiquinone/menaquinone biosynthesis C-methylase UbiE